MKNALIIEPSDIKRILSEYYKVDISNVKSTGYSYYVELSEAKDTKPSVETCGIANT